MSGSKRTSQLGVTTSLANTDRLVVLTNPSASAQTQTVAISTLSTKITGTISFANNLMSVSNNLTIRAGIQNFTFSSNGSLVFPDGSYQNTAIILSNTVSDVTPAIDNMYNLGNSSHQWRSLYVTSNTIYVGGTPLSISNGTLTVNGTPVAGGGGTSNSISDANGSIVIVANSSGDGAGLSTIELIPDNNVPYSDQKIVIDPTAPNHIHIRAGGQQDNSSAMLFLGGEKNHVRVEDNNGVYINNEYSVDNYFYYSNADFVSASWYSNTGSYFIDIETSNAQLVNSFWDFTNDSRNELEVGYANGSSSRIATYAGSASDMGGNVYRVQVNEAPPSDPLAIESLAYRIFTTYYNDLQLSLNDFRVEVGDDIRMYARDRFVLYNYSNVEPIEIISNYDDVDRRWAFHANGTIEFPDNTTQNTAFTFVANSSHWDGAAPTSLDEAINRLAILLKTLNGGTGA